MKEFTDYANQRFGSDDVSTIYSMINLGNHSFSFNDYKDMCANPTAAEYADIVSAIQDPMFITDLDRFTYLAFAVNHYHYSEGAKHIVTSLRDMLQSGKFFAGNTLIEFAGVGGRTALHVDEYAALSENIPAWLSIMFLSVFVILLLMTRSILLPIKAVLMSVLSLGATFGLLLWLFTSQDPNVKRDLDMEPTGYIDGMNVIFIFSVAFGLSVDYEVFLLSRVLEDYAATGDIDHSVLSAMEGTGRIITSAAVMLAVTTFSFIGTRVFFLKVLGVGIAIAVILDATVIRMMLVPSSIKLMGKYNMYCPEWLGLLIDAVGIQEKESSLMKI